MAAKARKGSNAFQRSLSHFSDDQLNALAGFWSFTDPPDAKAACSRMLLAQKEYGWDKSAVKEFGPIALGRNLYALLPEDDWDEQPLVGGNGRFALVSDLRLDNRAELSRKLGITSAESATFADSDYLLRALERWGEQTPEHLLGDFAFAWFDRTDSRLILARDPLGQRPLFWHQSAEFIAFASMPKGLHSISQIARFPNIEAVARLLGSGQQLGAESFFAGVKRVPPGHVLSITPTEQTSRRYWNPQRQTLRFARLVDYVDAFRAELDRAVSVRLRTRKPSIAVHLSGGWDSGAVAATTALLSPKQVMAFTATPSIGAATTDSRNRFSNEWPLAAAVAARHPSLQHFPVENNLSSPLNSLDRGVRDFERPLFNLCNHGWLAQIREAAQARGAQVLLSGEIGNWSISAGPIDLLSEYRREHGWQAWWRAARGLTERGEARWRGILANSFHGLLPNDLWRLLEPLSSGPSTDPIIRPEVVQKFLLEVDNQTSDRFSRTIEAYFQMDFGEYRKGILGGWGIDKRDPTSDVRLIEFCLSLPTEMLLSADARRPLARAALSDRLPPQVINAVGKGYQSAEWHVSVGRDLKNVQALVTRIAGDPVAASVIDVDRLTKIVRNWPSSGWEMGRTIAIYRNALLQALTAGHFLINASGRSSNREG